MSMSNNVERHIEECSWQLHLYRQNREIPNCPSIIVWINRLYSIPSIKYYLAMKYYTALKKNLKRVVKIINSVKKMQV